MPVKIGSSPAILEVIETKLGPDDKPVTGVVHTVLVSDVLAAVAESDLAPSLLRTFQKLDFESIKECLLYAAATLGPKNMHAAAPTVPAMPAPKPAPPAALPPKPHTP